MKTVFTLLALLLGCQQLVAQDLEDAKTEQYPVPYHSDQEGMQQQTIRFPIYHVPKVLRDRLFDRINTQSSSAHQQKIQLQYKLPTKTELDVHDMAVLNQGANGVCTFFSTVTAIQATVHPSTALSPMCMVQLDKYLHPDPKGSITIANPLHLVQQYGIVPLRTQEELGCAGIYEFNPRQEISVPMSTEEYLHKSEIYYKKQVSWRYVFDNFSSLVNSSGRLTQIKKALLAGRFVILEFMVAPEEGAGGAVGQYKVENDTWVLTPRVVYNILERLSSEYVLLGHAIVIIGYDDDAEAIDENGETHRGLIKLRNSWGARSGDHGDFYMSYDYLAALGHAAVQVCSNQQGNNLACW